MLNVHELERRWMRYKIKQYLAPVVVGFLIITVLTVGAIWLPSLKHTEAPLTATSAEGQPLITPASTSQPSAETINVQTATTPPQQHPPAPVAPPSEQLAPSTPKVLHPSMEFIRNIEEEVMPYYETETVPSAYTQVTPSSAQQAQNAASNPQYTTEASPPQVDLTPQSTTHISITQESANDLKDVIKRFKVNKKPALSLFVARKYYELGEYKAAYDYALQTNELDSDIEESWLIFAKSLVKLGHQKQAVKTLTTYVNHSRSAQAKALLDSIKKGTFQ